MRGWKNVEKWIRRGRGTDSSPGPVAPQHRLIHKTHSILACRWKGGRGKLYSALLITRSTKKKKEGSNFTGGGREGEREGGRYRLQAAVAAHTPFCPRSVVYVSDLQKGFRSRIRESLFNSGHSVHCANNACVSMTTHWGRVAAPHWTYLSTVGDICCNQ